MKIKELVKEKEKEILKLVPASQKICDELKEILKKYFN